MQKKLLIRCTVAVAVCLFMGFLTSAATEASFNGWYAAMDKTFFHPPTWVFNAGWILTYCIMGIAVGIVWAKGFYHKWVKVALYHFGFQIILTAFWPILFFGFQKPFLGLLNLIALIILLLFTIKWFKIVSDKATYLLYPYAIWILYLAAINFDVWKESSF